MAQSRYQQIRVGSIRERLQFLLKDSALYGTAASLSRMLSLLILPVLTRLLSKSEFGALDAMTILGAIFVAFIIMGQDSAIARLYYESEDEEERKQIITQALMIEVVLGVVVTAMAWVGADLILREIYGIEEFTGTFQILVVSTPFVVLVRFASNLLKWTFARYEFIVITFGSTLVIIVLQIIALTYFDAGIPGVYGAYVAGNALFAGIGMFFCRKHFAIPRGFSHCRELLTYGAPYMVIGVTFCVIPALDRVFITKYLGLEATGLYAIGYRYAFLIMLPVQAFLTAWTPFSLAIYKESTAAETYSRALTFFVAGMCGVCVIMTALAEPLILVVASERFFDGYVVVFPLLLGLIVQSIAQVTCLGIQLSKKTYLNLISHLIGLGATVFCLWVLTEPFGIVGAAYGVLLGKTVQAITCTAFAYRADPLRFGWKRPLAALLIATAAGLAMHFIRPESLEMLAAFRSIVVVAVVGLIWFAAFDAVERATALSIVSKYLGGSNPEEDPGA